MTEIKKRGGVCCTITVKTHIARFPWLYVNDEIILKCVNLDKKRLYANHCKVFSLRFWDKITEKSLTYEHVVL